jgi:hypothetical protein
LLSAPTFHSLVFLNPQVLRQHFAAAVPKESLNSGKSREEAQE